jgi:7,8-dihydro-6-hydroxymethylpterin-pyrophosphokinase
MHERRFVIEPLAEIAPNVVHPTLEIPISIIMDNLSHARSVMK